METALQSDSVVLAVQYFSGATHDVTPPHQGQLSHTHPAATHAVCPAELHSEHLRYFLAVDGPHVGAGLHRKFDRD